MIFLPIVERELRVAARRRSTYWVRVAAALVSVAIGAWWLLVMTNEAANVVGANLFVALTVLGFSYALMAGVQVTSDCLSEEKREGTLGLLFLTDLKGYDVVLGKLAATSLNSCYGLISIFPVMAIPLLLGGVDAAQFWRVTLVCLNTLFLSLTAGMFASAISRHERKAMGAAFLTLLLLALGIPLLVNILDSRHWVNGQDSMILMLGCPPYSMVLAFDSQFRAHPESFWLSVALLHCLGWGFILAAGRVITRSWQDKPSSPRWARWRAVLQTWSLGDEVERRRFRSLCLEGNPILWLAGRDRLKYAYVWAFLGFCGCLWLWGWSRNRHEWLDEANFLFTMIVLHTIFKVWLTSEATHRFNEDRNLGALELLLSTPLQVPEIIAGQLLALQRQFASPVLVVLGVDLALLLASVRKTTGQSQHFVMLLFVTGMTIFIADLVALSWTGMWLGLTRKKANRAFGTTLFRVLFLPWILFCVIMIGLVVLEETSRIRILRSLDPDQRSLLSLGLWIALSLICAAYSGGRAYWKLHAEFRSQAMERFSGGGRNSG